MLESQQKKIKISYIFVILYWYKIEVILKSKVQKKTRSLCVCPPFRVCEFVSLDYITLRLNIYCENRGIVSLFGVTDFLATVVAVRTIIFVVITVLHNIGGPPQNHSFSNGRRPPLLENGRFPARRHWPDDFPFRSPRTLRPVRLPQYSSFALSVFTFHVFRFVLFFF